MKSRALFWHSIGDLNAHAYVSSIMKIGFLLPLNIKCFTGILFHLNTSTLKLMHHLLRAVGFCECFMENTMRKFYVATIFHLIHFIMLQTQASD